MRILVVDDDKFVREVITAALASCFGHEVNAVSNGKTGLQCFMEHIPGMPFDLVVTDFEMPGMNGIELAKAVKANSPATPVILVSGNLPAPEDIPWEVDLALQKPVPIGEWEKVLSYVETKLLKKNSGG